MLNLVEGSSQTRPSPRTAIRTSSSGWCSAVGSTWLAARRHTCAAMDAYALPGGVGTRRRPGLRGALVLDLPAGQRGLPGGRSRRLTDVPVIPDHAFQSRFGSSMTEPAPPPHVLLFPAIRPAMAAGAANVRLACSGRAAGSSLSRSFWGMIGRSVDPARAARRLTRRSLLVGWRGRAGGRGPGGAPAQPRARAPGSPTAPRIGEIVGAGLAGLALRAPALGRAGRSPKAASTRPTPNGPAGAAGRRARLLRHRARSPSTAGRSSIRATSSGAGTWLSPCDWRVGGRRRRPAGARTSTGSTAPITPTSRGSADLRKLQLPRRTRNRPRCSALPAGKRAWMRYPCPGGWTAPRSAPPAASAGCCSPAP